MFMHNKKLQYTVRVAEPNPVLGTYMLEQFGGPDGENFALSLWLRSRRQRGAGPTKYALNLVGTSAFTHREGWSIRPPEKIDRNSQLAAVKAVFMGTLIATNAEPVPGLPIWRGIVASPIMLTGYASDVEIDGVAADKLTVGAITLNSNRTIAALDAGRRPGLSSSFSIMSALDGGNMNQLAESLQWAAAEVLAS